MHLGGSNLAHAHERPRRQQGNHRERFRCGRVFHKAWLRLPKEVIGHSVPQQSCQLLHRKPGLVRKLLESGTGVEWNKRLEVVTKDRPETDRGSKLSRSETASNIGEAPRLVVLTDLATMVCIGP